jgi:hypothetical protein
MKKYVWTEAALLVALPLGTCRGSCFGGVSLDIGKARPAEAAKDEMDIRIKGWDDGRMCHHGRSLKMGGSQS